MKVEVFVRIRPLNCKMHIEVIVLWKHGMIPQSLRTCWPDGFPKTITEVQFLTKMLTSMFLAKQWIQETTKMHLAGKSQSPDCSISSVLPCEYVCCQFQPTELWTCIKIDEQSLENCKKIKSIERIEFWCSAAETTAFKLLHQGEDEDRLTNCLIKNANKIIHVFTISNKS